MVIRADEVDFKLRFLRNRERSLYNEDAPAKLIYDTQQEIKRLEKIVEEDDNVY